MDIDIAPYMYLPPAAAIGRRRRTAGGAGEVPRGRIVRNVPRYVCLEVVSRE